MLIVALEVAAINADGSRGLKLPILIIDIEHCTDHIEVVVVVPSDCIDFAVIVKSHGEIVLRKSGHRLFPVTCSPVEHADKRSDSAVCILGESIELVVNRIPCHVVDIVPGTGIGGVKQRFESLPLTGLRIDLNPAVHLGYTHRIAVHSETVIGIARPCSGIHLIEIGVFLLLGVAYGVDRLQLVES